MDRVSALGAQIWGLVRLTSGSGMLPGGFRDASGTLPRKVAGNINTGFPTSFATIEEHMRLTSSARQVDIKLNLASGQINTDIMFPLVFREPFSKLPEPALFEPCIG